MSRVRVRVISKTLKNGSAHILYSGPPEKGGIIQGAGCLIRLTDHYKCLAFDNIIDDICPFEFYLILLEK